MSPGGDCRDALALEAHGAALGGAGRDLEHHGAFRRRRLDAGAERRLPRCHRQIEIDVLAFDLEQRIGRELHLEIEIARLALAHAGRALAGEADVLALAHALGDGDVERAILDDDVAGVVDLRHAQGDRALGAGVGVAQVDDDLGVMVLALGVVFATARRRQSRLGRAPACAWPNRLSKKSLNCAESACV